MKKRTFCAVVLGFAPVVSATAATPNLPETYSFTANSNMMGPMTLTVHRNGSKELIEMTASSGSLRLRTLYDFQSHRIYTVDLSTNRCTTQEYTSAWAPTMHDPVAGPEEMLGQMASLPVVRREAVNGIAARVVEAAFPDGRGKYRSWLEEKFGFPVKQTLVMGSAPERLLFEIRQISYAPSAASLFVAPANCTQIAGTTSATGGHAEMKVEATASGDASLSGGKPVAPAGDSARLIGKWEFTGRDGAGTQWRGTLTVAKLDPDSFDSSKYSNSCDLELNSGNAGKGASGPCLYDPRTKTFSFAGGMSSMKYSFTAVLSPDGKSLAQGRWVEEAGAGSWLAARPGR